MIAKPLSAIVLNEMRMRMRRLSTLVVLCIVVFIAWSMVPDPATGGSMVVVDRSRLAYNGTVLSLGSALLASLLFGLGGFYLARGRTREDLIYRTGAILAATPVSNTMLIFARWLGATAYLSALGLAVMFTMMVMWFVRGDGEFQPHAYVQMYFFLLFPTLCFVAGVAVLCDAIGPLMGKLGDVLYFILWLAQFTSLPGAITDRTGPLKAISVLDFSGMSVTAHRMMQIYDSKSFALGRSGFDSSKAVMVMSDFWTYEMMGVRIASMLVAMLPLVLAALLFHRYSPERVQVSANQRASLFALINRLLSPARALVRPWLAFSARVPGAAGQALADMASTLMANPAAIVALPILLVAGAMAGPAGLKGVLMAAMICWGIVVSDLAVRDHQSATESLTAAVPGGVGRRYLRQYLVAAGLGLLFALPVLLRWSVTKPFFALVLVAGVLALSAAAAMLGKLTRTGRTFLGLFLFGYYISTQLRGSPWLDAVGYNGAANVESVLAYLGAAVLLGAAGYWYETRGR